MTPEEKRAILVRAKAREFAAMVRGQPGLAFLVPDAIIDWLDDSEIPEFFAHCRAFRIVQRSDRRWEGELTVSV